MRSPCSGLLSRRWLLVLVASALTVAPSAVLEANGRVGQYMRSVAGPYEIALGTIPDTPVVGVLHLTVTVSEAESKDPILDAEVTVAGTGPEGETPEIGPILAVTNPRDPLYYDVSTSVDRTGLWSFRVSVSSGLGEASTEYLIDVRSPSPFVGVFTWVTILLFVTLVGLGILPSIRARRRRKSGRRSA